MAARGSGVRYRIVSTAIALLVVSHSAIGQQSTAPSLTEDEQEAFLKKAKVVRTRGAGKGVTNTLRATLSDGTLTHEASIQTIDESMQVFKGSQGVEFNFKDSWRYNVAAYRLNRVLQLGRIPVSVERTHNGKTGSFTWWVDDVLMDEGERLKTRAPVPDTDDWNRQMWHVRIFDQLIYNVDRNLGNLVIDKAWRVWMIDHSRAFRLMEELKAPKDLRKIERGAFERLKTIDRPTVDKLVGNYLTNDEKRRMLQRRDAIVKLFESAGADAIYETAPKSPIARWFRPQPPPPDPVRP
jgi:hypothetical protein